jgi:hypothetical protein
MKAIAATVGRAGRRDFFWLDRGFSMMASSPVRGLGFNLRFGGTFTSLPAAVAAMARPEIIFTTGDAPAAATHAPPSIVPGLAGGGVITTAGLTQRINLFGLGGDYVMYHKRFWGEFDQDDLSPWQNLGGIFTSAPAAIVWEGSRIDLFGVGMDHAMYCKTCKDETWTLDWQRLGGRFTSAASMVSPGPKRLDIFARGADFALKGNHSDGATWFGWQSHGGSLASPPVVVSWGPDRIDIFAIFKDGALWHRWWDGQLWNEWESLGGSYTGEPAAAASAPGRLDVFVVGAEDRALYHYGFSSDTWSIPEKLNIASLQKLAESPTVISAAPNRLELFVPTDDNQIRIGKWDGQAWNFGSAGASFRAPSRYRMSVDLVRAKTTRALSADTDAAMVSVGAGNAPAQIKTQWIGDLGGGGSNNSQTNLLRVEPVTVDLAEPMSFSYLVVNNGHAAQDQILAALAVAGNSLSLAGSAPLQEKLARGIIGFVSEKMEAAIAAAVPFIGSVVGKIASFVVGYLTDTVFESCDGVVAVELRAMMGRDLFILTNNGRKTVNVTTQHSGTDSADFCGNNSDYEVTWTIEPL